MPYPRPRLRVVCDPPEVPAGYAKPVTVSAEVVNPAPNVHYWFHFDTTDGEIRKRSVWGTRAKGRVVAKVRWYVAGVGPAESSVDVDATIYPTHDREGKGEGTGSDAAILRITEEDVEVEFEIEQGEDCGDFTEVRQGELVCFHGHIKTDRGDEFDFEPHIRVGDVELDVTVDPEDETHFFATADTNQFDRGFQTAVAWVKTIPVREKQRRVPARSESTTLEPTVRPGSPRKKTPKGAE